MSVNAEVVVVPFTLSRSERDAVILGMVHFDALPRQHEFVTVAGDEGAMLYQVLSVRHDVTIVPALPGDEGPVMRGGSQKIRVLVEAIGVVVTAVAGEEAPDASSD